MHTIMHPTVFIPGGSPVRVGKSSMCRSLMGKVGVRGVLSGMCLEVYADPDVSLLVIAMIT